MIVCLQCVRKHLSKARAYLAESRLGYPMRIWDAIGEMGLAEDECVLKYPIFAEQIRQERMKWLAHATQTASKNPTSYAPYPVEDECYILIDMATELDLEERQ